MSSPDAALARLARRQHGLITAQQAADAGLTSRQIRRRVDGGRWQDVVRGTYLIAGVAPTWRTATMAAMLARPGATVSHQSAACLWGLPLAVPPRPTITVDPVASARTPIATVHRRPLLDVERTMRDGFVLTTAARTLVDLTPALGPSKIGALLDDAIHRRLTTVAELHAQIDGPRAPQLRRHLPMLRARMAAWDAAVRPDSIAEARLIRLLSDWGLPDPERQIVVADEDGRVVGRIDVGWPRQRVGLEYDSVRWHGPDAWAHDQRRHHAIVDLGWRLIHVDAVDLRPGRSGLRDRLHRELGLVAA